MVSEYRSLKDAEHILNVTLKNNRSYETIKSFLKNIAQFYDEVISEILSNVAEEIPNAPVKRALILKEKIGDNFISQRIDEYLKIRKALRADFEVINEHRRNVEVVFHLKDGDFIVNPKTMKDLLTNAKEFLSKIKELQ